MFNDALWEEIVSGLSHNNHRQTVREGTMAFRLGFIADPTKQDRLTELAFDAQLARLTRQPQITLERAIGHICKLETSEPAGAAAQILSKLSTQILKERWAAA